MSRSHYRIAGLTLAVDCPASPAAIGLPGTLAGFAVPRPARRPHVLVRWEEARRLPPLPREDLVYSPGRVWRMFRGRDGHAAAIDVDYASRWGTRPPAARLWVSAGWDRALLQERMRGAAGPRPTLLPRGPSELLVRTRLVREDGLVLHACGLDDNGRGILLAGPSGAGKSTQAALWSSGPGVAVLNDDRVAVRLAGRGASIHGTPWSGDAGAARGGQAPLAGIFLIEQGRDNALLPLSPAAALPLLAARAFLPWWDAALLQRSFAILERLVARVPVHGLRCRPEPSLIPLVRAAC